MCREVVIYTSWCGHHIGDKLSTCRKLYNLGGVACAMEKYREDEISTCRKAVVPVGMAWTTG